MSLCINPHCPKPQNPDTEIFCQACGWDLLLAGRYRIIRLLSGKGGFGRTYLVNHNGKDKVLKLLINPIPKAVTLFQQEARVLSQLNHPGIPQRDGYFTFNPRNSQIIWHFLVMAQIQGMDLEDYQQQRQNQPIDQRLALDWLLQLAEILHEVHSQNFFHRDIKPSNIILQPNGQLVLIDFGTVREVTATYNIKQGLGNITGIASAGFTPPEQINFHAVPQSDFFALGRTFVFLLTGKAPSHPAMYDALNDELVWRSHTSGILPDLLDFIDKLMMRTANQRPPNTTAILERLAEINLILNPPPPPVRVKHSGSNIPVKPISSRPNASPLPNFPLGRRKIIQLAGLGGMVAVGAIAYDRLIKDMIFPGSGDESLTTNLQSFNFDVITLDSQGRENSRNSRSANFFPENLGNGITLEMVAIPGGTFTMGSPTSEAERDSDESPQHSVTISPFYMGKYTVTQAQWRVVAGLPKVNRDLESDPSRFKGDNLPVESINWLDATEFCARLSKYTGRNYRLPTEAEWEYACRAGTNTPFHFGETISTECANYDGNSVYGSKTKGVYREKTTKVGSFYVANNFGLYDMHGNVWEWCEDSLHENYQDAPIDGSAWLDTNINNNERLLRGGSWYGNPESCRSANRVRFYWVERLYSGIGFRLVCGVPRTF